MASHTDALLQTVSYAYSDSGNETLVDYPTGVDTSLGYDGAGRTTSMVDATGASSWAFNAAGEVTSLTTPQGAISYVYNLAGQATSMVQNGSATTAYSYDAHGRFSSLTNQFGEATSVLYDSAGRLSRKNLASGVYETFSYDARSRPTLILVKNSANSEIDRKEYVWDVASRVTSALEGGVTSNYGYDAIDQLVSESKPALSYSASYAYDANGNRTSRTVNGVAESYSYDGADKLTAITGGANPRTFGYDLAGRTTSVVSGAGTTSLAYDFEGRVTGITYPGSTSDSFGYNGAGARTSTSGTNGSRTFFRNGLGVTSPVLGDGTASYTPAVSTRSGTASKFQHAGLKNTSAQSAQDQTVAASRVYDAFGNVVSSSGSWSGPFGYAGSFGYQEDPNGLKLLGHRYYDSSTGRFLSQDAAQSGRNWYSYTDGSPIHRIDPNGEWWQLVVLLIVVIGGIGCGNGGMEELEGMTRTSIEPDWTPTQEEWVAGNIVSEVLNAVVPKGVDTIGGTGETVLEGGLTLGRGLHVFIGHRARIEDVYQGGDFGLNYGYHENWLKWARNNGIIDPQ